MPLLLKFAKIKSVANIHCKRGLRSRSLLPTVVKNIIVVTFLKDNVSKAIRDDALDSAILYLKIHPKGNG